MAGDKPRTSPDYMRPRPAVRYTDANASYGINLVSGMSVTNGSAVTTLVPIAASAKVMARIKTSGNGTLDLTFGYVDSTGAFTAYTTGNPTQVVVTGGTEAAISSSTFGENWCQVKFTPSANGTVTYIDVSQV